MSDFGTWIFAGTNVTISDTRAVHSRVAELRSAVGYNVEVQDWPAEGLWSVGFSVDRIFGGWDGGPTSITFLSGLVEDLAIEIDAPVAAGWCENGATFAACLSGSLDKPLILGFNYRDWFLTAYDSGPVFLAQLERRWGEPWEEAAAGPIAEWLHQLDPTVSRDAVLDKLEDDFGNAAEGLVELLQLTGPGKA